MSYDYASELLTRKAEEPSASSQASPQPAQKPFAHDYANDLLSPPDTFSKNMAALKFKRDQSAGFGATAKQAMVDDPKTKMRILAADLFPGEKNAIERFGMLNGQIMYVGKDDKLYKATPGGVEEFAADVAGNALPIVGGTIGGILGAAGGPPGMIAGAALGAAGGKGYQEAAANLVLDEPQTVGGNVKGMAKEAAFAGAGAATGALFQKWLERNVARDIGKYSAAQVADLDAKAKEIGVDLNVAQRTNVPSLKGRAEALSRLPQSADDMNTALEATRQQAGRAADAFIDKTQPYYQSIRQSGEAGRQGANEILDRIATDRSTAAKPYYDKAFEAKVDPKNEALQRLMDTDAFKKGYDRALRIAKNEGIDLGGTENMRLLHYVKMGIDDLLDPKVMAKEGIGATEQRGILAVKNRLLQVMDDASPDYKRARGIYGHYMPTLKANREGILGEIANLADEDVHKASQMVFNKNNSADDVARLRSLFYRHDQGEKWKALTKGYLEDTLENASKQFKSGEGAGRAVTWRYMLLGDLKQAANLRAAMNADQWQGFQNMMDVFEAVGRVKGTGNSITMPMTEAAGELKKEAGGGLGKAIMQPRQTVVDWLEEARLGKHAKKQVEILNDPNGLERLKELRRLDPRSKQFIQGFTSLFGAAASPE